MTPITVKEPWEAGEEGLGLVTVSRDSVYTMESHCRPRDYSVPVSPILFLNEGW